MSTTEVSGLATRIHRSGSFEELWQDRSKSPSRRNILGTAWIAALLAVPIAWTQQDPVRRAETLGALSVPPPDRVELPLQANAETRRWVVAFETTRRAEFERLMSRRALYSDLIRTKLRERGMPEELLYIPVIESGLSPFAVSRVSAVGIWQFMSPTALQYGLRIDEYVDERRDPVRATEAALDYLAWLNERFGGSWYLAAAAFNAGPGRLERILTRHAEGRRGDDAIFWEIRDYLPRETREYVPKMIAFTSLARRSHAGEFHDPAFTPYDYETVFVPGGTVLAGVARDLGVRAAVLRELNPHLVRGVTPPGEIYGVRVPRGGAPTVVDAIAARQAD